MDFGALAPEINSGRMYLGPGAGTLSVASARWETLAAELTDAAGGYQRVIASLTDESWWGPASTSMAAAVAPYIAWMTATAGRCRQAATRATAAAAAFETAYAMTVPPPLIVANRAQLVALSATNLLGQNTPAIMATEAEYGEMWARDASAMYTYAANSASASAFSTFTPPPQTTGTRAASNARPATAQLISEASRALRTLATPGTAAVGLSDAGGAGLQDPGGLGEDATTGLGQAASLGELSVPASWADAVSSVTPPPALDANVMPGGWGAGVCKPPSRGKVGRESEGPARRIVLRSSMIPRSPVGRQTTGPHTDGVRPRC
jgi:PPE family/PPE-SVP subfamily C-terminal region